MDLESRVLFVPYFPLKFHTPSLVSGENDPDHLSHMYFFSGRVKKGELFRGVRSERKERLKHGQSLIRYYPVIRG